jgi:hypothetical protein
MLRVKKPCARLAVRLLGFVSRDNFLPWAVDAWLFSLEQNLNFAVIFIFQGVVAPHETEKTGFYGFADLTGQFGHWILRCDFSIFSE